MKKSKILVLESTSVDIITTYNKLIDYASDNNWLDVYNESEVKLISRDKFTNKFKKNIFIWWNTRIINRFDVVVTNIGMTRFVPKYKKIVGGPKIVEFMHGTHIKSGTSENFNFNKLDYYLIQNNWQRQVILELGWNEQFLLQYGYGRFDHYKEITEQFNFINSEYVKRFYELIPMAKNKRTFIFAPSWVSSEKKIIYNLDAILNDICQTKEDWVLIVSAHNNFRNNVEYEFAEKFKDKVFINGIDFENSSTDSFMFMCDQMITDFSSTIIDFGNVKGFDKIKWYDPRQDELQNEITRNLYKHAYRAYSKNNSLAYIYDLSEEDYKYWFEYFNKNSSEANSPTSRIFNFLINILNKSFMEKNCISVNFADQTQDFQKKLIDDFKKMAK